MNSETELTARQIFEEAVRFFQEAYPHRNIVHEPNGILRVDGTPIFNSEGHNLLFNLTHLTHALRYQLL